LDAIAKAAQASTRDTALQEHDLVTGRNRRYAPQLEMNNAPREREQHATPSS
jgi:hypothetical protein